MSVSRKSVFIALIPTLIFGLTGVLGAFPVSQESSNPYLIDRERSADAPVPPFEGDSEQILRFYPPVAADTGRALRVYTSPRERRKITLLTAGDSREILLPQTEIPLPIYLHLSPDQLLTGILLPEDLPVEMQPVWLDSRRGAPSVPEIYLDNPEVLYYSPPAEDRSGDFFYSLKLKNSGLLHFEGLEEAGLVFKPFPAARCIALYPDADSSGSVSVTPLSALEFLEFEKNGIPDFPVPLSKGLGGILDTPLGAWRNPDFELYSWTLFPDILIWDCQNYDIQNRFFRRLSYFVEKKGFRGSLMTNGELEGMHGWNAHDYRPEDLARFYTVADAQDFPLYQEEVLMKDILIRNGIILKNPEGGYSEGKGAVLSISRETSEILRERFLVHESSHGLYFTSAGYRDFVLSVWEGLEEEDRSLWRFFLGWHGYDPEDEDLMVNEFQAYLVQQRVEDASEYFNIRMKNLLRLYPAQESLLSRGIGEKSESFRIWSGIISHWLMEKWGLEPGDFFPLYKELPQK